MARFAILLLFALFVSSNATAEKLHVAAQQPNNQGDLLAFSAELSEVTAYAPGSNIIYDRVHSNVGGLYYNTNGQFVCPGGLYVFIWNLNKASVPELPGMRCICSLSGGVVELKYGPKSGYIDTSFSSTTEMTAVHECSSSPLATVTVTVQPWTGDITRTTVFNARYTTFSGFNLQAGIAFTAELSEDQNVLPGGRIMFNNILANYGGHFEQVHGSFRCPDDGVYVFTTSAHSPYPIASWSQSWSVSRLMMEMETIIQGPITSRATEDYDGGSASTTTVVQCTPGFSVYVEAQAAHDFTHNSYGAKLTSFTGFKLYDVSTETVAFTVAMTQNVTLPTPGQVVGFDEVITNIGSAFDTDNHRFVCPDDAHYMFAWSIARAGGSGVFDGIDLHMDSSDVKHNWSRAPSSADDTGTSGSTTMSVIRQCQPDSVYYLASRENNQELLGGFISFSGYKLPG